MKKSLYLATVLTFFSVSSAFASSFDDVRYTCTQIAGDPLEETRDIELRLNETLFGDVTMTLYKRFESTSSYYAAIQFNPHQEFLPIKNPFPDVINNEAILKESSKLNYVRIRTAYLTRKFIVSDNLLKRKKVVYLKHKEYAGYSRNGVTHPETQHYFRCVKQ